MSRMSKVSGALRSSAWIAVIGAMLGVVVADAGASVGGAPVGEFDRSVRVCQFWKGGPVAARRRIPTSDPFMRGCLARRGWTTDGLPVNLLRRLPAEPRGSTP